MSAPESWRPIPGHQGYEISDLGRIASERTGKRRILSRYFNSRGYPCAQLHDAAGAREQFLVHRLVLMVFVGPPPKGTEAAHLDGNPKNPSLSNLAWVTHVENMRHKKLHGTERLGERNANSVLTAEIVLDMRRRAFAGERIIDVARELGIHQATAQAAVQGRTWSHLPIPGCLDCSGSASCGPHLLQAKRQWRRAASEALIESGRQR